MTLRARGSRAVILVLMGSISWAQESLVYQGKEEKLPFIVAPQPVAFSHKDHILLGMSCRKCHPHAQEKERAGLPTISKCMLCHIRIGTEKPAIQQLAQIHRESRDLEWIRVYRIPDFVFFSHASHVNSGIACESCHGPVQDRHVLNKEVTTNMESCMNCHATRKVSMECHFCHELGQ